MKIVRSLGVVLFVGLAFILLQYDSALAQSAAGPEEVSRADESVGSALKLLNENDRESWIKARQLLSAAAETFTKINDTKKLVRSFFLSAVFSERLEDSDGAYSFYNKIIALREQFDDAQTLAIALNNLGLISTQRKDIKKAIQFYEDAIEVAHNSGLQLVEGRALTNLGTLFEYENEQLKALSIFQRAKVLFEATNSERELGLSHLYAGRVAANLGNTNIALEDYTKASEILRRTDDRYSEATSLNNIGLIYGSRGEFAKALPVYEAALVAVMKGDKSQLEGMIRYNLGDTYLQMGDAPKALLFIEKALSIFEEFRYWFGAAQALNALGVLNRAVDNQKALNFHQRALIQCREIKNPLCESQALFGIGDIFLELNNRLEAKKHLELSAELAETHISGVLRGTIFIRLAEVLRDTGESQRSLAFYRRAIEVYRTTQSRFEEARALAQLGILYSNLSDYKAAVESINSSIAIHEEIGDKQGVIGGMTSLGVAYASNGQYRKAIAVYKTLIPELTNMDDKEGVAVNLALIGQAHGNLNEYQLAITSTETALDYFKTAKNDAGEYMCLSTLGFVYTHLGEQDVARSIFGRASELATKLESPIGFASAQVGMGATYLGSEEPDKAIPYYEKAIATYRSAGLKSSEAVSLNNLGYAYGLKEDHQNALRSYLASQTIYRSLNDAAGLGLMDLNIGYSYLKLGNREKALPLLNAALRTIKTFDDKRLERYALHYLAEYWLEEKNYELTIFYGKQAVNLVQSTRSEIVGLEEQVQKAYIKQFEKHYRQFADLLIERGRIAEAELVLSMLKEEEFFEFLRRDGTAANELLSKVSLTPTEQKAYDEYQKNAERLTELGKELGELKLESKQYEIGKFPKQARLDELEKQIENANVVFLAFLDKLKLSFSTGDSRVAVLESGSQALLKELNEPQTVFISTISGEEKLNIVLTTAEVQKAYTVPLKSTEMNKLVADFRAVLRNPAFDARPAGKKLFDKIFPAGLTKDLEGVKADTIVWSLDGTLRYVPISALWDGEKYLVEKFNNVIITLASRDKIAAKSNERSSWNALGVGVSKKISVTESDGNVRSFDALTAVPEELCSVISDANSKAICATTSGAMNGRLLLDEAFTLKNFKDSLGRFPVVHIASHFSLNAGNETDSYLLLGGGEDRRLTLASIRQSGTQFVGVDLLTLSACNTGMSAGNKSNGIEVEGFGVLAQRSGAKSVLASLWAVSDASTRDLMINFYRNLDSDRTSGKADALRKAQLTLLRGKTSADDTTGKRSSDIVLFEGDSAPKPFKVDPNAPYSHPYYWSPFVLIGNWQ